MPYVMVLTIYCLLYLHVLRLESGDRQSRLLRSTLLYVTDFSSHNPKVHKIIIITSYLTRISQTAK